MEIKKIVKYAEYSFSGVFFTGIFVFYTFFYNNHLHFEEQFQLFLLTDNYFIEKIGFPGGFSGWSGEFLSQFYYVSWAGPLIITGLLFAMQLLIRKILYVINSNPVLFPLTLIPSLLAGLILCNEFYPLSAITGIILALLAALAYITLAKDRIRFITGLIIIPLTYWLAGGSFISLLLLMLAYEFLLYRRSHEQAKRNPESASPYKFKGWYLIVYFLIAAGIPLLVRQFLILQPLMLTFLSEFYYNIRTSIPAAALVLFVLPALLMLIVHFVSVKEKYSKPLVLLQVALFAIFCWLGIRSFANFEAEEIMTYDYLARNERWNDVLKYADRHPPRNYLSLAMLNLSLSKTGQLGNRMFAYNQHGINGLFLPFNRDYVTAIMGNEILYQVGLTNASQEYAFESMETIPSMGKSARVIKRLAETNMINSQYKVSEKYLKLLEKTIFYRKWAMRSLTLLNNEEKINEDPVLGEKRMFMVRNDYFFHIKNIEAVLNRMVKENPGNKMAFEYLMAFYMINKDLRNVISLIPVMEKMQYKMVPVSYQEAIMYIIGLNNEDPMTNSPSYVSQETRRRMKAYNDIFSAFPDAEARLEKRFSDTYWFYLDFRDTELSQVEENKNNTGST